MFIIDLFFVVGGCFFYVVVNCGEDWDGITGYIYFCEDYGSFGDFW